MKINKNVFSYTMFYTISQIMVELLLDCCFSFFINVDDDSVMMIGKKNNKCIFSEHCSYTRLRTPSANQCSSCRFFYLLI